MNMIDVIASALREAEQLCPPGTRGRDVTGGSLDTGDALCFDLVTEYDPRLAFGYSPILRTTARYPLREWPPDHDAIRRVISGMAERHNLDWAAIHGPEHAAAAAEWLAKRTEGIDE